jgi:DNA mismatch endonuclease Vsr
MQQVQTSRNISEIMRSVRSKGTAPELAFRKALRTKGLTYKIAPLNLAGKPDLVLPSHKVAIFIDGDFWHGGQWSKRNLAALEDQFRSTPSKEYWLNKIRRNIFRDCAATDFLISQGWTVLRFWESDVLKNVEKCIEACSAAIEKKRNLEPLWIVPSKTFAEFFAGIGLMRMGLERQGWASKFANDIDPQKLEMYRAQFADTHRCFSLDDIQRMPAECAPTVTMATASFPCNDLSLAGARAGLSGKQSSTFWGFVRILEEMDGRKPPIVLLENVTGFLTSNRGQDFKDALIALNRLGYFADAFILNAASFVPQSRQRLFVVGVLDDTPPSQ